MNSTEYFQSRSGHMFRSTKWLLLCGLLSLVSICLAMAEPDLYENNGVVSYVGATGTYPPDIDATNFVNTGSFTIDFTYISESQPFFETSDTLNYTNTGTMESDTGFQFDNQSSVSGARTMSGSFNNSGLVSCGFQNAGEIFLSGSGDEDFLDLSEFEASATNIVNNGTVDVGTDGFMFFAGQNLDLARSSLVMASEIGATAYAAGTGVFGLNTNYWDPSVFLTQNFAESAFFPIAPFELFLPESTPYFNVEGTTNEIIRAVFIEDDSAPNVSYNVYFGTAGQNLGGGDVTIQWTGTYLDPVTGNVLTNYLYLNNNYALGGSTNVALINGIPDNLDFTESATPLLGGFTPAPAGFINNIYPAGTITNLYSYGNVQLIATTEFTNVIANRALTNIVGRIQISASNELNLAYAQITGANYLSVQSPHEFDGSPGALIQSPYTDLNLGVTNGFLTISNLLAPAVPIWNGPIQAWDTRWLVGATNGVTNDFRVLIVASQLTPTTLSQVQNMLLHSTNSIVISDALNIINSVTADAQNLTLTTNGAGVGATSLDGELDVGTPNIFWASSFPNLLNLTNNGAIRLQNVNQFIGTSNNITILPTTMLAAASNTLSEISGRTNVTANNAVTIGSSQYVFVGNITNAVANQVKIAMTFDGSLSNLIAAINHGAGSGTIYSTNTSENAQATAGLLTSHAFTVTAVTSGSAGNSISTATTSTNLTWDGITLAGGADNFDGSTNTLASSVPYDNFINSGVLSDQGSTIWANNFVSGGYVSNGIGSFVLESLTTTLTNGALFAGGDISITAEDSLETSNLVLQAGRSLTLAATNLTDDVPGGPGVVTNGNSWVVDATTSVGLNLPLTPINGDLLGTTITNIAPFNKNVINTWAGRDFGDSVAGYSNNAAIGRLILDGSTNSQFTFIGTGASNAIYVDYLELLDQATNRDSHGNPIALTNSANLVIYYAQAVMEGVSVAELLDHENNDHLRWVPAYAGHYSSTNIYYAGATNFINAALAQSQDIDSSGDGIPNIDNPAPVFVSGQVNFSVTLTNVPPFAARISWNSIPDATNYLQYATSLPPVWITLTNYVTPPAPPYAPIANVFYDTVTNSTVQKFYRVVIDPNVTDLYGP
jgi:hypothetical protein